jgi:hypothetical protein
MKTTDDGIRNLIVISDTHTCSSVGLMPPGFRLDDGQWVTQSPKQKWIWSKWGEFWDWAYTLLGNQDFALVHNGDQVDGRHHFTTQLISGNLAIQQKMAIAVMEPHVKKARRTFFIRGTESHVGQSAEVEEMVGRALNVEQEYEDGPYTRWDLLIELGEERIHFAHHIATTSSQAYKSSPLMRIMAAAFGSAGEHRRRPPSILVRGHCHDYTEVKRANCRVVTCPSWQLKTGFVWKFDTVGIPIIGGLVIRLGKEGVHIREKVFALPEEKAIRL